MIIKNRDFEAHYTVEELVSPDVGADVFEYYPNKTPEIAELVIESRGSETCFRIRPQASEKWIARCKDGPGGLDGVFSTPSPNVVCIVVKGQGYWIHVTRPDNFSVIRSLPIKNVIPVPSHNLLVFTDYVRVAAYAPDGCAWVTEDLSWDGIKVGSVENGVLQGEGWDSPADRYVPFSVDIASGKAIGGSSPEKHAALNFGSTLPN